MAVRAGNGEEINFFETGYIMIGNKRYDVEEISINQSRDMNPYHVASQRDPIAQRPGRNKIDFSFKRAFGDSIFLRMYQQNCVFTMVLFNNDYNGTGQSGQRLLMLTGCRLSQDNIGPINGGDIVSEDIQGSTTSVELDFCKIVNKLEEECDMACGATTQANQNIYTMSG